MEVKELITSLLQSLEKQDYESSIKMAERGVLLLPNDENFYVMKSIALRHLGRRKEAISYLEETLQKYPFFAIATSLLALSLFEEGNIQSSLDLFDKAVKLDHTLSEAHYYKSQILVKMQRYKEALEEIKKAVSMEPYDTNYQNFFQFVQKLAELEE